MQQEQFKQFHHSQIIINRSNNFQQLKKIFKCKIQKNQNKSNQQSLLLNQQNPLTIIKAYRNRKKIQLSDFWEDKQIYSTIDSPQKNYIKIESKKIIQQNSILNNLKVYQELIKKLNNVQKQTKRVKFPNINKIQSNEYQDQIKQYKTLQLSPKRSQNQMVHSLYQKKLQRNNNEGQDMKIIIVRKSKRNSGLNNIIEKKKQQIQNEENKVHGQEQKLVENKIDQNGQNNRLSELRQSQSNESLAGSETKRKNKTCYLKYITEAKKFLQTHRVNLDQPPKVKDFLISGISATSFAVIDSETFTPIACRNFNKKIQIASISKVMTCYLALLACKKYKIDYTKYKMRVSQTATQISGTSAELQVGDNLTLEELFYALMLPSGNDASIAIAETIGKIIQKNKKKQTTKTYYETFIAHMNILSRELKLDQVWRNSHGLPSCPNYSTPKAISCLTVVAMMDRKFKEIVSCKKYELTIKNDRFGLKRKVVWTNTNKLLQDDWEGVKTGTTDAAGHCLMAKKGRYLISVFNSKTLSKRFSECQQLYDFIKSRERYIFQQKWE